MMLKSNINFLIISVLFVCFMNAVYGQKQNLNKNAIYGSIGIGSFVSTTAHYERIISQKNKISSFVKAGIGTYGAYGVNGNYILTQYGILTGAKNHHLELGAGFNYFYSEEGVQYDSPFTGTIGWRLQKLERSFIVRTGVSWPEGLYLGTGFSF